MADAKKPTGLASSFPSIEKKYGEPIAHRLALLDGLQAMEHREIGGWL